MKTTWDKRIWLLVNALETHGFITSPKRLNDHEAWAYEKVRWFSEADSRGQHQVFRHPQYHDITIRRAGDPIPDQPIQPMQEIVPRQVHLEYRFLRFGAHLFHEARWTMVIDKNLAKNMADFMPLAVGMVKAREARQAEEARRMEAASRERERFAQELRELIPGLRHSEVWNSGPERRGVEFKISIERPEAIEIAKIIAAIRQIPGVKTPFPEPA